jgi:hypothetical protein
VVVLLGAGVQAQGLVGGQSEPAIALPSGLPDRDGWAGFAYDVRFSPGGSSKDLSKFREAYFMAPLAVCTTQWKKSG